MRSLRSFIMIIALAALWVAIAPRARAHANQTAETDALEARFDTGFVSGSFQGLTVRRVDIGAGIRYRPLGLPLTIGTGVRVGPTSVSLRGPLSAEAAMDVSLMHWTNLSLQADAELTIYRGQIARFDLYGGFEMSALDDAFTVADGRLSAGGRTYDVTPFLDDHLMFRYGWSRIDAGLIASFTLGRFTPRIAMGFQRIMIRMTTELDGVGKTALRVFTGGDGSVERLYEEDVTSIRIAPGCDVGISNDMRLSAEMMIMPAADAFFIGGRAAILLMF